MPKFAYKPRTVGATRLCIPMSVHSAKTIAVGNTGDWAVADIDGTIRFVEDEDFRKMFETVDEEGAAELAKEIVDEFEKEAQDV